MYNIVIFDHDNEYMDFIENYILEFIPSKHLSIYKAYSEHSCLNYIDEETDLIFIDYTLDTAKSIDTAKKIRNINNKSKIVFLTSGGELSAILFELNTFRVIDKARDRIDIKHKINEIISNIIKDKRSKNLIISKNKNLIKVELDKVLYIAREKYGSRVYIVEDNEEDLIKTVKCSETIEYIYSEYMNSFGYPHSSYIVNLENIKKISNTSLIFKNNTVLSISKSKKKSFKEEFFRYCVN